MTKMPKLNWGVTTSVVNLTAPVLLGGVGAYLKIRYNVSLTPKELLLIDAIQFISSLWFGWVISFIFSERSFQERQKKFAISAYRRIKEIENLSDRIISRIRSREKVSKAVGSELDTFKEMMLSLRGTVQSSKADWGDIIGDEIRTLEEIEKVERSEHTPNETLARIEELLARLPSSLEIEARQSLGFERILSAAEEYKAQLVDQGYITLEGFWDQTFEEDIFDLPIGSILQVRIDDVAGRIGALIASTINGKSVGVIINTSDCNYDEFIEALTRVLGRSKFQVEYTKKGYVASEGDDGEKRHYFECKVLPNDPQQLVVSQ